jgi:hypothetical protein
VADALPAELAEEVVLTGSVSRGMADDVSDIEMLVVTREPLQLEDCFGLARAAGLDELGTWGAQGGLARRVSGYRERVPLELIWWPRDYAEAQIDALLAGAMHSTADALAHGISLRTSGRLAVWQERLRAYPPDLAAAQIEEARAACHDRAADRHRPARAERSQRRPCTHLACRGSEHLALRRVSRLNARAAADGPRHPFDDRWDAL